MESQLIGKNKIALVIKKDELASRGIETEQVQSGVYVRLVEETLRKTGLPPLSRVEIELYDGPHTIMIFAEFDTEKRACIFTFVDIEILIQAVGQVNPSGITSSLTYHKGEYWLEVKGDSSKMDGAICRLIEFGQLHDRTEDLENDLLYDGKLLIKDKALEIFQQAFHKAETEDTI